MTYDQNKNWLKTLKTFDLETQWTEINKRYFYTDNWNVKCDSIQYSPLIVVNGVPLFTDSLTTENDERILKLLNQNSINEINIIDKLSDDWIFCKPFTGVIVLSVDKKTSRKLFKFNF